MVTTTFCVSGAVLAKAGEGINLDLRNAATEPTISGASIIQVNGDYIVDQWITEAEALININSRHDFTDVYTYLSVNVKTILQQVASSLAAIEAVKYDMSGYTSREEAKSIIDVERDAVLRGLSLLRDKKVQDFITDA